MLAALSKNQRLIFLLSIFIKNILNHCHFYRKYGLILQKNYYEQKYIHRY